MAIYQTMEEAIKELKINGAEYSTPEKLRELVAKVSADAPGDVTIFYSGGLVDSNIRPGTINKSMLKQGEFIRVIGQTPVGKFLESKEFEKAIAEAFNKTSISEVTVKDIPKRGTDINDFFNRPDDGLWAIASKNFAAETRGEVYVIAPFSESDRILAVDELPELLSNSRVTSINGYQKEIFQKIYDEQGTTKVNNAVAASSYKLLNQVRLNISESRFRDGTRKIIVTHVDSRRMFKGSPYKGMAIPKKDIMRPTLSVKDAMQEALTGKRLNALYEGMSYLESYAKKFAPVDKTPVVDELRRGLTKPQREFLKGLEATMHDRGDSEKAINMAVEDARERFQENRVYVGKVLKHGEAPYGNDPKKDISYYVKLQTENGEKIVWGADLKRAVDEGNVKDGDEVALAYQGRHQDTVKVKERDEQGKVIGESKVMTNRITWGMRKSETISKEEWQELRAAASRAERQPLVKVYDRDASRKEGRPEVNRQAVRENKQTRR